jgi:hypothetical protein
MTRRHLLGAAACAFVALGVACVDLFHSTDFETLCKRSPTDPQCAPTAADAGADVVETGVDAAVVVVHPDFCAWTSAEAKTQALRACAWLGACEAPMGESAFGQCVIRAQLAFDCGANPYLRPVGAADAFWGCMATAASCSAVDRCVFPGGPQDCNAVPSGSFTACATLGPNKGVRVKCGNPVAGPAVGIEPCVMLGQSCSNEDSSNATCSGALGYDTCTTSTCSGSNAVDCATKGTRKLDVGVDCALLGASRCVDGDAGPVCAPVAAPAMCTGDTAPSCNGTVSSTCVGGKEIHVNCNILGLPCDVTSAAPPAYDPAAACTKVGASGACVDSDTCNGNVVQSCGRGLLFQVDCASVGLGPCAVDANGHAACGRVP